MKKGYPADADILFSLRLCFVGKTGKSAENLCKKEQMFIFPVDTGWVLWYNGGTGNQLIQEGRAVHGEPAI